MNRSVGLNFTILNVKAKSHCETGHEGTSHNSLWSVSMKIVVKHRRESRTSELLRSARASIPMTEHLDLTDQAYPGSVQAEVSFHTFRRWEINFGLGQAETVPDKPHTTAGMRRRSDAACFPERLTNGQLMRFWRRTTNVDGMNTTTHEGQITRPINVSSARITKMWRCHVNQVAFLHLFCFFYTPSKETSVTITSRYACPLPKRKKRSCSPVGSGEAVNLHRHLRHKWSARRHAKTRRETRLPCRQVLAHANSLFPK